MSDFPKVIDFPPSIINSSGPHSFGQAMGLTTANNYTSHAWPSANSAIYVPFVVAYPVTIVKIFWQNGSAVSGNIDVGIYGQDGTRLVSIGSTAQSGTTAVQSVDITDTTLSQGLYYMAMALDNATGQIYSIIPLAAAVVRSAGVYSQATAFALPSTATYAGNTLAIIPKIMLTTKTTI